MNNLSYIINKMDDFDGNSNFNMEYNTANNNQNQNNNNNDMNFNNNMNFNYNNKKQKFINQNCNNPNKNNMNNFMENNNINDINYNQNNNHMNNFNNNYNINSRDIIKRDIHKAYVGFNLINYEKQNEEKTIATGNWGCGAFGGNHELKFLEQWIAASLIGVKRLDYYTFGSEKMANCMKFYLKIKEKYRTAINLLEVLVNFKIDNNNIIGSLLA